MKIEIEKVSIKNFLSFGNVPQEIPLNTGVNLVLGIDHETGRSNGAGKSSFLEAIPYCLFGETLKPIKKDQIINWKNKKGLEVSLDLVVNAIRYRIERAIKPDNLSIFKDGSLIQRDAHTRDYQKVIEEIIGMSFQTFHNLVHSNINSSNKILAMKKPEKRKFIEDVFGLQIYSELNMKANEKIRVVNEKVTTIDASITSNNVSIGRVKDQIEEINRKIKGIDIEGSHAELKTVEAEYNIAVAEHKNIDRDIKDLNELINSGGLNITRIEKIVSKIDNSVRIILNVQKEINSKIEELKETEKTKREYLAFVKEHGSPKEIVEKIAELNIQRSKIESECLLEDSTLRALQIELSAIGASKKMEDERLERLKDYKECPTCGTPLVGDHVHIVGDIKKRVDTFTSQFNNVRLRELSLGTSVREKQAFLNEKTAEIRKLEKDRDYLYTLKDKIKSVLDERALKGKFGRYEGAKSQLKAKRESLEAKIGAMQKSVDQHKNSLRLLESNLAVINSQRIKIDAIKQKIDIEGKMRAEFISLIDANRASIASLLKEIDEVTTKKNRLIAIIDYLNVIKEMCKDENIKRFAISSIMPYLNRQTNYYLSEVGYGFFTVIDKWLDAEIRGPGISNASYGSLSGGEARGIDLALQFGLLDIAKIQAGSWPDVLILDEILDSSVDGKGIGKLVEIVKAKQLTDNNKIFIISHREELEDFEQDNIYYVEKDGYSRVSIR